nr:winged helix-turn-helix domain-containing protein [Candidatus Sigynarchaeota archaeon]
MTYGGKQSWIDLAQRKDPTIEWFIIVGKKPKKDEEKNYWEDADDRIKALQELQKNYPDQEKIFYEYLDIPVENDLVELVRYFRGLINHVKKKDFTVSCNLTAGLFEMQIALYLAAQIESEMVSEIFFFNKQTFQKNFLFKSINITNRGKDLLRIFFSNTTSARESTRVAELTLSQLQETCEKNNLKIDLPSLSRLVKDLIKGGYVDERREGREKFLSITDLGMIFCPVADDTIIIKRSQ